MIRMRIETKADWRSRCNLCGIWLKNGIKPYCGLMVCETCLTRPRLPIGELETGQTPDVIAIQTGQDKYKFLFRVETTEETIWVLRATDDHRESNRGDLFDLLDTRRDALVFWMHSPFVRLPAGVVGRIL